MCRTTDEEQRQYERKRADEVFATLLRVKRLAKRRAQEIANRVEVCGVTVFNHRVVRSDIHTAIKSYTCRSNGRSQNKKPKGTNERDVIPSRQLVKW